MPDTRRRRRRRSGLFTFQHEGPKFEAQPQLKTQLRALIGTNPTEKTTCLVVPQSRKNQSHLVRMQVKTSSNGNRNISASTVTGLMTGETAIFSYSQRRQTSLFLTPRPVLRPI
jgi:hypothetical protein